MDKHHFFVGIDVSKKELVVAHARAVGFRSKTDSQDAKVILDYAQKTKLHHWKPAPLTLRILKQYVDQTRAFKKMIVMVENRMEAHGFEGVSKEITQTDKAAIRTLERLIAKLETSIKSLVADDELLDQQIALLKTIPGIALDSACKVMAYTRGEITQRSAKQLTAFAGLAPARRHLCRRIS